MNRAQVVPLRIAVVTMLLSFAGTGWASSGACLNPSGTAVSGCSAVDGAFSGFITPSNNDFSSAGVGTNYLYNPTLADQGGAGWTFSSIGTAGGGSNDNGALIYGSQWYASAPPAGSQVAGLQQFSGSTSAASVSEEVGGFTVGDDYAVSFYIDERNGPCDCTTEPEPGDAIEVSLGGQLLGTFTPTSDTWTPVTTGMTAATSSTMNLEFYSASLGVLSSSEVDTLFTDVVIDQIGDGGDPAPEPATLTMTGGVLALVAMWRMRRRSARRTP